MPSLDIHNWQWWTSSNGNKWSRNTFFISFNSRPFMHFFVKGLLVNMMGDVFYKPWGPITEWILFLDYKVNSSNPWWKDEESFGFSKMAQCAGLRWFWSVFHIPCHWRRAFYEPQSFQRHFNSNVNDTRYVALGTYLTVGR